MAVKQQPVPGFYYINLTGQLIKVRALVYNDGSLARVVVEYLDGRRVHLPLDEWNWLELDRYSDLISPAGSSAGEREFEL